MTKEFYHIYCKGILGVKTNVDNFKWLYGSVAPISSREEYDKCIVKIDLCVKPEQELGSIPSCDKKFQSYSWDSKTKTIFCRRTLFLKIKIGFNIRIEGDTIYAEIGRHYYKYVQNRIMNLHGIYYLLSDLANIILLKNGYLSLYASVVHNAILNKGIVHFAPPNTGKTLTATKLCELPGYNLVGEDIAITDGFKVYSCPWTSSYRKSSKLMDDAGSLGREKRALVRDVHDECELTDLVVLSLGERKICTDKNDILEQIRILNGYLFGYYSTPIVKILAYFDEEYRKSWYDYSASMFKKMVDNCDCRFIQNEKPIEFFEIVDMKETEKNK